MEPRLWLEGLTDREMRAFYGLLDRCKDDVPGNWQLLEVIRLDDGSHVSARSTPSLYFPSGDSVPVVDGMKFVKMGVLKGRGREADRARSFLETCGVREAGEREEIVALLKEYYDPKQARVPARKLHFTHMRRFLSFWQTHKGDELFRPYHIFLDESGKRKVPGSAIYIDEPYQDTSLGAWFRDLGQYYERSAVCRYDRGRAQLWAGYLEAKLEIVPFARSLGAITSLVVREIDTQRHPAAKQLRSDYDYTSNRYTDSGINEDYDWDPCVAGALAHISTPEAARAIWLTLHRAQRAVLRARFRPNQKYEVREAPSTLVHQLRKHAWVPDRDGGFRTPMESDDTTVPDGFPLADTNGWREAVGFGERTAERRRQRQERVAAAEAVGLPVEVVEQLGALYRAMPDVNMEELTKAVLDAVHHRMRAPEFPERDSPNPERRAGKVRADAAAAPAREYQRLERSVRASPSLKPEAKAYLTDLYQSDDGAVVCQICEDEMPFRLKDGSYYFEAVQVAPLAREYRQNYLALCPVCSAKYRHANESEQDLVAALKRMGAGRSVPLRLAGAPESVRFVGTHLTDLRAILEAEEEGA